MLHCDQVYFANKINCMIKNGKKKFRLFEICMFSGQQQVWLWCYKWYQTLSITMAFDSHLCLGNTNVSNMGTHIHSRCSQWLLYHWQQTTASLTTRLLSHWPPDYCIIDHQTTVWMTTRLLSHWPPDYCIIDHQTTVWMTTRLLSHWPPHYCLTDH